MRQDVTKDDRDIESTLQAAVVDEVGQDRFELWFGGGVQLQLNGGSLRVMAPEQFTLDCLRSQFRKDLQAAARRLAGEAASVEFGLAPIAADASENPRTKPHPSEIVSAAPTAPASGPSAGTSANDRRRPFAKLDQFVVGGSNRLAATAAGLIAEREGTASPLFLFGSTGVGKTHLLEGIWSAVRRRADSRHVLYLSAEQFTTMFLEALRGSGLPSFRHKYRHVDLLLIDDVQFFLGKRATLVELQHTVDALHRGGRQLVLACDRSPAELSGFGPELVARFSGGLVCGIEPSDNEVRRGIIRQLAADMRVAFPDAVLDLIASQLHGDARQLAGALNQLEAVSLAFKQPVSLDMAQSTLADMFKATCRVVHLSDIDRAVCDVFGLEPSSLQSPQKARTVSQPRALAMWLARKYTRAAYSEIGSYFGRRSHSTVISANKQVSQWVQKGQAIQFAHGQWRVDEAIRRVELHIRAS
jgi:chromosomal replication initiator protein